LIEEKKMRRLAVYLFISILTFLVGFATASVLDRSAASMIKVAHPNALLGDIPLFEMRPRLRQWPFIDDNFYTSRGGHFYTGGGSVMVMDEKTGRIYCKQAGD
jgi:hypothetical protein